MNSTIHFSLSFPEAQAHYVDVQLDIQGFENQNYIDLVLPVWAPGSYLIREYAKNVERFRAADATGVACPFTKVNKNTWRVQHHGKALSVTYAVYGFESSVRTSFINREHAFLSPVGVFFHIQGQLQHPVTVSVKLPENWPKISTGLEPTNSSNTYYAANFDILYDSPFEIGNHDTWSFEVEGVTHECAMVGEGNYNKQQLTEDITKIVAEENKIWGSNPNNYYLFITHNHQNAFGGLEHLNSTVLACSRFAYQQEASYKSYLSLVAHEYFHLWNVKRLRPKALGPFDYNQENYTTGLWIMEGFTAYYDNLIVRRCGFYSEEEYLQQLAIDFNTVYNRPGYQLQSAAAASFDTWIKQYRPDENSANTSISYYNKGAMHAVALDIKILVQTEGKYRLDDVLKAAYNQFYIIENRGFEEEELQKLAEDLTGVPLDDIFKAAHSVEELDYNRIFNEVGYEMVDLLAAHNSASLGVRIAASEGRSIIKQVDRDSAAWHGGLNVEDELLAVDLYRVDTAGKVLDYILASKQVGEQIKLVIARDGLLQQLTVTLQKQDKKNYVIQRKENSTLQQQAYGNIWLSLS